MHTAAARASTPDIGIGSFRQIYSPTKKTSSSSVMRSSPNESFGFVGRSRTLSGDGMPRKMLQGARFEVTRVSEGDLDMSDGSVWKSTALDILAASSDDSPSVSKNLHEVRNGPVLQATYLFSETGFG